MLICYNSIACNFMADTTKLSVNYLGKAKYKHTNPLANAGICCFFK